MLELLMINWKKLPLYKAQGCRMEETIYKESKDMIIYQRGEYEAIY
jgi:hypothetical protein